MITKPRTSVRGCYTRIACSGSQTSRVTDWCNPLIGRVCRMTQENEKSGKSALRRRNVWTLVAVAALLDAVSILGVIHDPNPKSGLGLFYIVDALAAIMVSIYAGIELLKSVSVAEPGLRKLTKVVIALLLPFVAVASCMMI